MAVHVTGQGKGAMVLVAWCFCGLAACAQQSSSPSPQVDVPDLTGLSLEDLSQVRLSTASRHLEDPRKSPSIVTVITAKEIEQFGWRSVGEMLNSVAGFYMANDRTYTYLGVRGFLESGDYNSRILVQIDGHRINENIFDGALVGREFPLDLALIDRVEVLRGPGGSMYGTNAELAVVNIITRRPGKPGTLEILGEAGSFADRMGSATLSFRTPHGEGIASASLYRSNGEDHLFFPEYATASQNNGYADNMDGERFDHAYAQLRRGRYRLEAVYGNRTKITPNAIYGSNFNDPGARARNTRWFVEGSSSRRLKLDTDLDLRVYYDSFRLNAAFPYGGNLSSRFIQVNHAFADWMGGEGILSRKIGHHRVVGGLSFEHDFRIRQVLFELGQLPLNEGRETNTRFAVFGETELNPRRWLSLNLGGRIDSDKNFGSSASPRIALMVFPDRKTSLKYVYSRAFRAPDPFDEISADSSGIHFANRSLQPEIIHAQNVVVERELTPGLKVVADWFDNRLRQTIENEYDASTGVSAFQNTAGDNGRGVELETIFTERQGWSARASLVYSWTHDLVPGIAAANSPHAVAKLNGTAPVTRYGTLGVEMLWTGAQNSYLNTHVSPFFLTNTTLSTHSVLGGWKASISCSDLLDRAWATPTGPESIQSATQQNRRTVRFSLTYSHRPGEKWGRP